MKADTDWMDGEIPEPEERKLNAGQEFRLMRMADMLRTDLVVLETVLEIKRYCGGDKEYARSLFQSLTEAEQESLWVAPKFGGIFTTEERKIVRNGESEA